MSNSKISALTSATTPLAGTEVLPIVQSGANKQVAISDVTAGRAVSAATYAVTGSTIPANGIYLPAANSVGIATASTQRMNFNSVGEIAVGGTAVTGYTFRLSKNITGATTSVGFASRGTIQSDVTSAAYAYNSFISTAAASFTLGNLYHYGAIQGSVGASSAITNQYGFHADSGLTGATNNYGFYGAIASGANRWNFYAAGTAPNYFAGTTTVGDNLVIGTSGKGIDFSATPGTGTSELFADYEEGTFTPVVADAATGGNTGTAALAKGRYTKVGRLVTITIAFLDISTTGMTAGNSLYIRGLPYTSVTDAFVQWPAPQLNSQLASTNGVIYPALSNNSTAIYFIDGVAAGTGAAIKVSAITSGQTDLYINMTYEAT